MEPCEGCTAASDWTAVDELDAPSGTASEFISVADVVSWLPVEQCHDQEESNSANSTADYFEEQILKFQYKRRRRRRR